MPSTITHLYFMLDINEKFPINKRIFLKDEINKMILFAQSTDPLNFYFSKNIKKSKNVRKFPNYFHTHKTGEYLITLINYIKYNYYKDNAEIMAYLYGMVSHYILDSYIHPFIYYNSGFFDIGNEKTYKYNNMHNIYENLIDQFFIKEREKCYPYKSKSFFKIFYSNYYSKDLIEVINFSFKETFGIEDYYSKWLKSVKNMKICFKCLRYDRYNIKNSIYKLIDKITPKNFFKLSFLSYHYTNKNIDYINKKHNEWIYPSNKSKKSKSSFVDIYLKALNDALKIISEIDNYIYEDKKINLTKLIRNNSYVTGIDLEKNQKMKYFKY